MTAYNDVTVPYDDASVFYDAASAPVAPGTSYTDTPLPHVRVLWQPEQFNRVTNPGFETNTTGWAVTAGVNAAGTSITRITTDHQAGTACGSLVTTATDTSGVHFDLGTDIYFKASDYGTIYCAVVWLKRVSGATRARLVLGSESATSDRGELDIQLRDKWTPYRVTWKPSAAQADAQLAIENGYAAALTVLIDSVSVYTLDAFSQVENANFRVAGGAGWDGAGTYIAGATATGVLGRATDGMDPTDQNCGTITTTAVSGSGGSYYLGTRTFTTGRTYRLRVAARSVGGDPNMRLRFGSNGTAADRGDAIFALTSTWAIYEVNWSPSATRTDACVAITNGSAIVAMLRFGLVEVFDTLDVIDSPYLNSMTWTSGQQGQTPRMPPGTFQVNLNDSGKRFFPQNTSSPLTGLLKAGRKVWARATFSNKVYPLYYGTIRRIVPDGQGLMTSLTGQDPLYEIAQADFEAGFAEDQTYNNVRSTALVDFPSTRRNLTTLGIEGSPFFSGNESQSALSVLEALNEATGTIHFVTPRCQSEILWQYTTIDRATLTDATHSDETFNDDFADLQGVLATDEALENHQYVPWQSYERQFAPDSDIRGYGGVAQAAVLNGGYPVLDYGQDPYMHFRDPAFGTDDNIPEPTFERITRFTKKGRKKVRKVRIYPDSFVPFDMAAGDVRPFTFDFGMPMQELGLFVGGPTGAFNIVATITENYPRHVVFELFAAAADTVDAVFLFAIPWLPLDEQVADVPVYDSIAAVGNFAGPSIQTPYINSAGMAEGIADHRNWRYSGSLLQPTVTVEQRFPSVSTAGIQRQIGDHITLVAPRWSLTSQPTIVTGLAATMDSGARFWTTTYNLEATPAGVLLPTLNAGTPALDSSVYLAH